MAVVIAASAQEKRGSAYVGEGLKRWAAVHRLDPTRIYRLAIEHRAAGARNVQAVADHAGDVFERHALFGDRMIPRSSPRLATRQPNHFGWFTPFAGMDAPASSERTRALPGWAPKQPGIISDIDQRAISNPEGIGSPRRETSSGCASTTALLQMQSRHSAVKT
jgi:hypothetical protein